MKNYERYPNLKRPETIEEYFLFFKDDPYTNDKSVSETFRWQSCIIRYSQWWLSDKPIHEFYRECN
jgi:hypothetical protein